MAITLRKVESADGGDATLITLTMTPHEADALLNAMKEGLLTSLGVIMLTHAPEDHAALDWQDRLDDSQRQSDGKPQGR